MSKPPPPPPSKRREFRNELSWSNSREKLFRFCSRAYWWRYYGHWDGWSRDAPEAVRVAYRLGKLDTMETWAGTIVHDVIEGAIKGLRDFADGGGVDAEELKRQARARLRIGWVQSRDGMWRGSPKRCLNLYAHYYGGEDDRRPERTESIKDRVYTSLDHFAASRYPTLLSPLPAEAFLNVEGLDALDVDGVTAYVKPDLAFQHPEDDGRVWLVDWKTGSPRAEDDLQLASYALYAREKWGFSAERTRAVLVYLRTGEETSLVVEEEALDRSMERIKTSIAEMRAVLRDPDQNLAHPDDFPLTHQREKCGRCNFRQLCYGTEGIAGAAVAGDRGEPHPLLAVAKN